MAASLPFISAASSSAAAFSSRINTLILNGYLPPQCRLPWQCRLYGLLHRAQDPNVEAFLVVAQTGSSPQPALQPSLNLRWLMTSGELHHL